MSWHLSGEYFESCSCDVLCPCITSQAQASPTPGYCSFVMGLKIEQGEHQGARLDGLNVAILGWANGPMAMGDSSGEVYLDSRATPPQRTALEDLMSGRAGGAPAALSGFMPKFLGFKTAAISYSADGNTKRLSIEGVGQQEVSGLPGMGGETLVLTKTGHPIADDIAVARATSATFKDEHFTIDNTGKNGHFAPFNWKG
ncbi:MAG: DUF1326 domain-containing protein [Dehalococcoidia bacterium]|nr:DUF1326 domain-containing protein [Dehalococcoidia bacterium]